MLARIMVNFKCSNNCEYCFVKSNENYHKYENTKISFEKIKKSIEEINPDAYEIVGGEPFENIDLLKKILKYNNGKKRITIFTSGLFNIDEFSRIASFYSDSINIAVSYDGKYSKRNKNNYEIVLKNIEKLKRYFNTTMRWSVNIEDIPHVYDTFMELKNLDIEMPLFFPMKYADYSPVDIAIFKSEFQKITEYCIHDHFNFLKICDSNPDKSYANKSDFHCGGEITILPDGKIVNCYVSFSSNGYKDEDVFENSSLYKEMKLVKSPARCKKCISVFNCCNKCLGNLREYQHKSGKEFFDSYCDLINELSKIYIKTVLTKVNSCASFTFIQGNEPLTKIESVNGEISVFRKEGNL